jgi:hypothetical protein
MDGIAQDDGGAFMPAGIGKVYRDFRTLGSANIVVTRSADVVLISSGPPA